MVRAILAGTKTQTRRVVKPQPEAEHGGEPYWFVGGYRAWTYRSTTDSLRKGGNVLPCPYGQTGERLWVREAWRTAKSLDKLSPSSIGKRCIEAGYRSPWAPLQWEADGSLNTNWRGFEITGDAESGKLRAGMFMPRWASRITLEVTAVRVERLQDISEADAIAEGIVHEVRDPDLGDGGRPGWRWAENEYAGSAVHGYELLWEHINGSSSWDVNPWVWVVEFRRLPC